MSFSPQTLAYGKGKDAYGVTVKSLSLLADLNNAIEKTSKGKYVAYHLVDLICKLAVAASNLCEKLGLESSEALRFRIEVDAWFASLYWAGLDKRAKTGLEMLPRYNGPVTPDNMSAVYEYVVACNEVQITSSGSKAYAEFLPNFCNVKPGGNEEILTKRPNNG
jgi:hypothetical protein